MAVMTTKKPQATITLARLWTKVSQRCLGSGARTGPPRRKYFATVRGETRIPCGEELCLYADVFACAVPQEPVNPSIGLIDSGTESKASVVKLVY